LCSDYHTRVDIRTFAHVKPKDRFMKNQLLFVFRGIQKAERAGNAAAAFFAARYNTFRIRPEKYKELPDGSENRIYIMKPEQVKLFISIFFYNFNR